MPAIVFDVNETLLDLETMSPIFERIFSDKSALRLWFANLVLYSEALTLVDSYVPFTEIGGAVLRMLAQTRSITISAADQAELKDRFSSMPPHPEVPQALAKLCSAGFRLFTITDNLLEVQTQQLEKGGIVHYFERRFSVDQVVRRHKPAREAYHYVERELGLPASELFLIAAHTWDTLGAVASGWGAALVRRPGNEILSVGPQPTFVGPDLEAVADSLIAKYSKSQDQHEPATRAAHHERGRSVGALDG
jgi:2-haloacid dehalogenase